MKNSSVTTQNAEPKTVEGFGREWSTFDQSEASPSELRDLFKQYFKIFPLSDLNRQTSVGADFGCGSGRWAKLIAPLVKHLHLVDASSEALAVARKNLSAQSNVEFHSGSFEQVKIADKSLDFAFSLGVLHHVPDTARAINDIGRTLKPGGLFLVYLYYSFDDRPFWFRAVWQASNVLRFCVSRLPFALRKVVTEAIAAIVYWPLARTARLLEKISILPKHFPLSFYRNLGFYVMRTDALDRFGTRLEKRYSRAQIETLLIENGFATPQFSNTAPYWCAVAVKKGES